MDKIDVNKYHLVKFEIELLASVEKDFISRLISQEEPMKKKSKKKAVKGETKKGIFEGKSMTSPRPKKVMHI